jgi:hypothetical protein
MPGGGLQTPGMAVLLAFPKGWLCFPLFRSKKYKKILKKIREVDMMFLIACIFVGQILPAEP